MITKKRIVMLNWVLNPSAFEVINQNSLVSLSRPLGTSVTAVNKMLARSEEMEALLPDILGTSPKSAAGNWNNALQMYWHNFEVEVPKTGKTLDISMIFDINASFCADAVEKLNKEKNLFKGKKIPAVEPVVKDGVTIKEGSEERVEELSSEKKEEILADYVMKNVEETEKFRYCRPANVEHYLIWRFCLVLGSVGNNPNDIRKDSAKTNKDVELVSTRIMFYLVDEDDVEKRKKALQDLREKAIDKYYEVSKSKDKATLDNYLVMFDVVGSIADLKGDTSAFKGQLLDIATSNPQRFVDVIESTGVEKKAEIKKLIMSSLIRRIPGSSIIADGDDSSIVFGTSIEDAVSFLSASVNTAYANTLRLKLANMLK